MKGFDTAAHVGIPMLPTHLSAVQEILLDTLPSKHSVLYAPTKRIITAPSKRLRSALVIASARPMTVSKRLLTACAAIELIHLGSLVHDDIMDAAESRWGVPTINHTEGVATAILVGDLLFAKAHQVALEVSDELATVVAQTIAQLCDGQALELADMGNLNRTKESYLSAVRGKTSSLLAAACRAGALCSNADKRTTEALFQFGQLFGVAFQLMDDVLDIVSTPELSGKPAMADVRAGVYTLPVILAKEQEPSLEIHEITPQRLVQNGTVQQTLVLAKRYTTEAQTALEGVGDYKLADLPAAYFDWALANLIDMNYQAVLA